MGDPANAKYLYGRARALMNESYYGQRAREAEISLGQAGNAGQTSIPEIDFSQVIATCDGIQLPPVLLAEPDAGGIRVVERARQLVAAGMTELALTELRWGRNRHPQDEDVLCYIMARIHADKRDYDVAISSLRRAIPDYNARSIASLPIEIWDTLFPVLHWGTVSEQASRTNIDPSLVLGIIRQESAFEEKARSKANARGLMQILPSTGRKLSRQARITRFNTKKLYDVETNIMLGTRFLAYLLQQYGKSELALAAYNAGDSRVDRWLKEWGNLDMVEFVEQIPFSETRGYVKQVLSNSYRYNALTSSRAPATR
jgi:soluble lytic murein transglycosylase